MFTGIIETIGRITRIDPQDDNLVFTVTSPISQDLQIDQSVSHNGVCLTVSGLEKGAHQVVAIAETLHKSNLGSLQTGSKVNLERSMKMDGRLDGHLVQGHVDATGLCVGVEDKKGSFEYRFSFPPAFAALVVEKGSICLNGISLTVYDLGKDEFSVSIIPYTYEHTNMHDIQAGDTVNLEFDMVGKYLQRMATLQSNGISREQQRA